MSKMPTRSGSKKNECFLGFLQKRTMVKRKISVITQKVHKGERNNEARGKSYEVGRL
jgi:hypothetical protein